MIVVDVVAEYVSREAFLYAPVYRIKMTDEQAHTLLEDLKERLEDGENEGENDEG